MSTPSPDHDALCHRFFSDPAIVAQLLRDFAAGPWLDGLELDAMIRVNTKFHAETGARREGDLVWRIPRRDGGEAYHGRMSVMPSRSAWHLAREGNCVISMNCAERDARRCGLA